MKRFFYSVILLFFTATLLTGCLEGKSGSPVIAKVNNDKLTQEDFLTEINRVPEWARGQFEGQEGKEKFLDEIIKRELIYQDAIKMKLDKDKEYISKLDEFKKMTLVSLVLQKEIEEKSTVTDEEVKAFFKENEAKFRIGTEIRASHILVETEGQAKDIIARINKGESFEKMAKAYSKDRGSADRGGDLGFFGRGKMVPEFEQAAMSLKIGELSGAVKTRFGYHVIKLTGVKEGEPANFEQSKDSIHKQLLSTKRKQMFDSYIEKLQTSGKIEKDQKVIASTTLPWEKAAAPAPAPAN